MGEVPYWYTTMRAAIYLGVPWWELMQQPLYYRNRAVMAMDVEASAREAREQRNANPE